MAKSPLDIAEFLMTVVGAVVTVAKATKNVKGK